MSSNQSLSTLTLTTQLNRVVRETLLVLLIGLNLLFMLSLISYDTRDSGWSHQGYQSEISNWAGWFGAWIADYSVSWFGVVAFVIPFILVVPAYRWLRRRYIGTLDMLPFVVMRTLGALLFVLSASCLASIHISNADLGLPFSAGGISGQALGDFAVRWLNVAGATVVLWIALLIGLTLYVDSSWRQVLDSIGGGLETLWQSLFAKSEEETQKATVSERPMEVRVAKRAAMQRVEPDFEVEPGSMESLPVVDFGEPSFDSSRSKPLEIKTMDDLTVGSEAKSDGAEVKPASKSVFDDANREDAEKRTPKIVPLSETHKPLDSDDDAEPVKPKAAVKPKVKIPSLDLLDPPEIQTDQGYTEEEVEHLSRLLEQKLNDFGVVAEVVEVNPGPVITRFEIQPAPGVKASKISNLAKDLARSMAVSAVRVVEVIPGKSVMGIEIPNHSRQMVRLSEVLNSKPYLGAASKLTLALGNDIAGNPVVANLAKMPHLLVAGTTGSGKSVGVNAMLLSLLYKATPEELRLMLVDPKMLELSIYDGIPHLLTPVITDMKEAAGGLRWCVAEMEDRYRLMAKVGVRNIAGFNDKVREAAAAGQPLRDPLWNPMEQGLSPTDPAPELQTLPYIVVVIDEFADMMMIVGKKVEELIARIAQKARAAGIHLILATQRPSVDVITGLIKANVPTRIGFQVSSKIDSRTILDQSGAENLLGNGDMLYLPAGTSVPNRVHGAFVSDDEVHRVVEAWKALGEPDFIDAILNGEAEGGAAAGGGGGLFDDEADPLYDEAVAFVLETRKASISSVQRKLKIGYNRAARMIETMEAAGVVSPPGSNGQREVMAPAGPRD
ncbi:MULTISPECIES: DNA translocase FtsK [unclassified Marinobacterium]|uniref:DNA translocase FtsK n=1 Tax=unclassified Marinobacterium TaxID=2644139 RepID=UPI00156A36F0|nr:MULTISPECIES: DNA translocase FtsK [unclassified Marinobacterium]NRP26972.1 DNA translocase FtsK [Marinobacterium sp. xm-d-420]NRP57112.1 DNA translocase FtsK [Marinobacterium sp. xm-d-510]NRP93947.1 DNA translocase FtsK [Marinobacterium sp. xm-g-59]NRP97638.1 DNA translocase FtsK [Marinobacterium sp. xm-a-127]NRQ02686.1 DNA translocase FtsK [Marinobacterium sp. xm-d-530]